MCMPKPPAMVDHDLGKRATEYTKNQEKELNEARQRYIDAFTQHMGAKANRFSKGGENA